jgi:hypothetical protein
MLWRFGSLGIVNRALEATWTPMWERFKCLNADGCGIKEACGDTPVFVEAGAIAVPVLDFTAPNNTTIKWRIYVTIGREIRCVAKPKSEEEDVTPKPYKTLPKDLKDLPAGPH